MYDYDDGGNIETKTEYAFTLGELGAVVDTVNYTYDTEWKDKLTSYDGKSISYDAIGNPINYMGAEMTWFARQMMSYETDDLDITYKYDSDGLRTQKVVNGVKHEYYYVDGLLVYENIGDENLMYYRYDQNGTVIAINRIRLSDGATGLLYPVTNSRGDVVELRNGSGVLNAKYTYDSWGKLISITDANGNPVSEDSLAMFNSIRYRGYVYDRETGLYYLQSRYYDPETGRFLNADIEYILDSSFLNSELIVLFAKVGLQQDLYTVSVYTTRSSTIQQEALDCISFIITLSLLLDLNELPLSYLQGDSYSWIIEDFYRESENNIRMVKFYSESGYYDYFKDEYVRKIYEFTFFYGTKASWNSYLASGLGLGFVGYLLIALNALSLFLDIIAWVYPPIKLLTRAGVILTGFSLFFDGLSFGSASSIYKVKLYIDKQGESLTNNENIALLYKVVLKTITGGKIEEKIIFEF